MYVICFNYELFAPPPPREFYIEPIFSVVWAQLAKFKISTIWFFSSADI